MVSRFAGLGVAGIAACAIGCGDASVGTNKFGPHGVAHSGQGATTSPPGASDPSAGSTSAGGGDGTPGGGAPSVGTTTGSDGPNFELNTGDATITADLLDTKSTAITIAPLNGFSGTVT